MPLTCLLLTCVCSFPWHAFDMALSCLVAYFCASKSQQEACQRQVKGMPRQVASKSEQQACQRHFKFMCIYTCTYVTHRWSMPLTCVLLTFDCILFWHAFDHIHIDHAPKPSTIMITIMISRGPMVEIHVYRIYVHTSRSGPLPCRRRWRSRCALLGRRKVHSCNDSQQPRPCPPLLVTWPFPLLLWY